jgi:hypothetical protein
MTPLNEDPDARLKKAYEELKSALSDLTESQRKDLKEKKASWEKGLKTELANQMEQLTARINSQLKK